MYEYRGTIMEYTKLGRTGLYVSRLCLGTMNFGCTTPEKDAFYIMDKALDMGFNFFDTANNYGFLTHDEGVTERVIGNWFAQGGGRRERVVLATKVHEDMHDPLDGPNTRAGLSIYKIRRHFEASLRRLQTEHVEIYYMHHVDRSVTWAENWDAFQSLFDRGLIDYVGASNFPAWQLALAQGEAAARHFMGISVAQEKYNLVTRHTELEVLPACAALGIGVVTWSPLHGGVLSGKDPFAKDGTFRQKWDAGAYDKNAEKAAAYNKLCAEAGLKPDQAALAWILHNPVVTAPIIGVRTAEQLDACAGALEFKLTDDFNKELDKIFPGFGGQAPEAYAW